MKAFWALILLLAIGAGVMWWMRLGDSPSSAAISQTSSPSASERPRRVSEAPSTSPSSSASSATPSAPDLAKELMASADARTAAQNGSPVGTAATGSTSHPSALEDTSTAEPSHSPTGPTAAPFTPPPITEKPGPEDIKVTIVDLPDGSRKLDDRFVIKGAGTKADPYQITWDLLVSASETYQPRLEQTELPERVTMLNGKHVRITGFLAFPLADSEPKECLAMLNRWDGCCLGVPPSPYDAVEVRMANAFTGGRRHVFTFGTVEGKLVVDPYLVEGWLVGLYLLEDARLDVEM